MASADFPRHFLRGISPGKNALLPDTTAPFTSTTKPLDFAVWCQLVASCRPSMGFLCIGLPVSPSLPPPEEVTLPELASDSDFLMFPCFGFLTGDSHPICNAPMLGAHQAMQLTAVSPAFTFRDYSTLSLQTMRSLYRCS